MLYNRIMETKESRWININGETLADIEDSLQIVKKEYPDANWESVSEPHSIIALFIKDGKEVRERIYTQTLFDAKPKTNG